MSAEKRRLRNFTIRDDDYRKVRIAAAMNNMTFSTYVMETVLRKADDDFKERGDYMR